MTPMRLLCVLLVLGCQSVLANPISNIRVFHTDDVPVREDLKLPPSMVVHVYNMDTKNNATAKLNEMVKATCDPRSPQFIAQKKSGDTP